MDFRQIHGGGSNRIVGDIDAVHLNAGRSTRAPLNRNSGKSLFRWIQISAVLNLHASTELRQIQKVASAQREHFNLLRCFNILYDRLHGVNFSRGLGSDLDLDVSCSLLEHEVAIRRSAHGDCDRFIPVPTARCLGLDVILARDESYGGIRARGAGVHGTRCPSSHGFDGHRCPGHCRTSAIGNRSQNTAGGCLR